MLYPSLGLISKAFHSTLDSSVRGMYVCVCAHVCVIHTVVSDFLWSHGLRNSPGKNPGVGCHFLLRGSFCHWDQTLVFHILGRFFTVWATREVCLSKTSLLIFQLLVFCIYGLSFRYLILMRSEMSLRKIMMHLKFLLNLKQNNGWSKFLKGNCFYN